MKIKECKTGMPVQKKKRISQSDIELTVLALPVLIKTIIFAYLPMIGIIIAFKNLDYSKGIFGSEWVGLRNFEFFFKSSDCWRVTRNTLCMNALFIISGLVANVLLALLLYRVINRSKIMKAYQMCMLFPHFLSWVIVAVILDTVIGTNGLINSLRSMFGLSGVSFYKEASYWPIILMLSNVWKWAGYASITYFTVLIGIDQSQYEAARIDGASDFVIMFKIQIPYLVPMIVINTLVSIGNIIRADFGMFYYLPGPTNSFTLATTDVIDTYIFRSVKQLGDMTMSSAVGVYQSLVGFVLIMISNFIVKKYDASYSLF